MATVETSRRTTKLFMFVRRRRSLFSTLCRRKGKTLPVGCEVPVAVVYRVDLEGFGHQRDVELHAHRCVVGLARPHLIAIDHMPRGHLLDHVERFIERTEAELQAARRYAVLARQWLKR